MDKNVFSEKEAGEILQKAARLQEASGESYTPGVSLEDLERIAAEAGISPDALRKALSEADQPAPRRGFMNTSFEVERVVDGELDPNDFDIVSREFAPGGRGGFLQQVGRTVQGVVIRDFTQMHVQVHSRHGRTRVKVRGNMFLLFMTSLYPGLLLSFILGINSFANRIPLLGLIGLAALAVCSAIFIALLPRVQRATERLANDLAQRIEDELRAQAAASGTVVEEASALEQRLNG